MNTTNSQIWEIVTGLDNISDKIYNIDITGGSRLYYFVSSTLPENAEIGSEISYSNKNKNITVKRNENIYVRTKYNQKIDFIVSEVELSDAVREIIPVEAGTIVDVNSDDGLYNFKVNKAVTLSDGTIVNYEIGDAVLKSGGSFTRINSKETSEIKTVESASEVINADSDDGLYNFKINKDVTLSDGSTLNFNPGDAVLKSGGVFTHINSKDASDIIPVEASTIVDVDSRDGLYNFRVSKSVILEDSTVANYEIGDVVLKSGTTFTHINSKDDSVVGLTPEQQAILTRTNALSNHVPIKVANLEAYRIFPTQQAFISHHISRGTRGAAAGVFGTPFDVTSSTPQPLTLRPIIMDFSPLGQTEIFGETASAGNGLEVLSNQDGVRYKFFNGIWINAAINKWYIIGVAGQSNSVGYGEQLGNENEDSRDPRIYQLGRFNGYFNKIIPATHCIHHIDNTTTENHSSLPAGVNADNDIRAGVIGPAKYLADRLISKLPDNTGILIVGGGNGGTGFSSALQGNTFNAYPNGYNLITAQLSSGENLTNGEVPYGAQEDCRRWGTNQPMFNDFIYRLKLALQLDNSFLLGIYWAQGESDVDADNINLTTSVGGLIDEFNTQMAANNTQMPNGDVRNLGWYIPSFTKWGLLTQNRIDKQEQLKQLADQRDNVYYTDVSDARTNEEDPFGNRVGGGPDIHFSNRGYRETVIPRILKLIQENPFSKGVFFEDETDEKLISTLNNGLILHLEFETDDNLLNSAEKSNSHKVDITNVVGNPVTSYTSDREGKVVNLNASNIMGVDTTGFNDSFTYSCAFKIGNFTQATNLFTSNNTGAFVLWMNPNNKLETHFQYSGSSSIINEYTLPAGNFQNKWFHVIFRWTKFDSSNGRADLFVNGALASSNTTSATPDISNMLIGRYANVPNTEFIGEMDDIRLYNRSIDINEIQLLYDVDGKQEAFNFPKNVVEVVKNSKDLVANLDDGLLLNLNFEGSNPIENTGFTETGYTVTISNLIGTPTTALTSTGRTGRVVSLDASNIIGVDTTGFNDSFTYSCSFRSSDLTNANNIFTTRNNTGTVLWLPANNRMQINIAFPTATNIYDLPSGTFLNQWFHVVFRWTKLGGNDGRSDLFLNGELVSSTISTDTPNLSQMQIGRFFNLSNTSFVGNMDDVRLYNKSLSNDEVEALYKIDGEQRILPLQETINYIVSKSPVAESLIQVEEKQQEIVSDVTNLETTQGTIQTDVTNLETAQGEITTDITNLETNQATITTNVNNLQNAQESIREHTITKVAAIITDEVASVEAAYTQYADQGVTGALAFQNIGGSPYVLDIGKSLIIKGSVDVPVQQGTLICVDDNQNRADFRRWHISAWVQLSFTVSGPTITDPAFPGTSSNPFLPAASLSLTEYDNAHYSLHDISASEWTAVKRSYTDTTVTRIDESSGQTKPTTTAELKTLFGD